MMRCKRQLCLLLGGSIGLLLLLVLIEYSPVNLIQKNSFFSHANEKKLLSSSAIERTRNSTSSASYSSINGIKTILLWDNSWGFRFHPVGRAVFINEGCPINSCFITYNSSYVDNYNFDAFLVHPPTQREPWKKLKNRRHDQIFVMFTTEPPMHMPPLQPFDGYFNWTISYRSGSDFHLPYGEILPMPTAPTSMEEVEALRADVIRANVNPARGKTKLAIWLVSNCNAPSNRAEYVQKMRKYMKVDIFSQDGRCGGVDGCPRSSNENVCYNTIERDYKFYLSFENSICDEYVTEKFYEMIARNILPVVLGGANYASIAPPHSYINALDYTPQQLAEYLMRLDANDTLYTEYFWWKPHYQVRGLRNMNRRVFCNLCAALHSTPLKQQTLTSLQKWYVDDAHCRNHPHYWSLHCLKLRKNFFTSSVSHFHMIHNLFSSFPCTPLVRILIISIWIRFR